MPESKEETTLKSRALNVLGFFIGMLLGLLGPLGDSLLDKSIAKGRHSLGHQGEMKLVWVPVADAHAGTRGFEAGYSTGYTDGRADGYAQRCIELEQNSSTGKGA